MKLLPEQVAEVEKVLTALASRLGAEAIAKAEAELGPDNGVSLVLIVSTLGCLGTFSGRRRSAWERL